MKFYKSVFQTIIQTKSRFLSIVTICMLGAIVLTGLLITSIDMQKTMHHYYQQQNFYDIQMISTYSFDEETLNDIKPNTSFIQFENVGISNNKTYNFRVVSDENQYTLLSGRLPQNESEIVILKKTKNHTIKIGDTIELTEKNSINKKTLNTTTFKVVGEVSEPSYIANLLGGTSLGNGVLDHVIYVSKNQITIKNPTHVHVSIPELKQHNTFTTTYEVKLKAITNAFEEKAIKYAQDIENRVKTKAIEQLNVEKAQFEKEKTEKSKALLQAKQKITNNENEIYKKLNNLNKQATQVKTHLEQIQKTLNQLATIKVDEMNSTQIALQKTQLIQKEEMLQSQQTQIQQAINQLDIAKQNIAKAKQTLLNNTKQYEAKIAEASKKIASAEEEIKALKPAKIYVENRLKNVGYHTFKSESNNIKSLATIFPLIFFFVCVLVTMMTMRRMIEEEKRLIGTLKSLGYKNITIWTRYIIYGVTACLIGTTIGVVIGMYFIPMLLFKTYELLFRFPKIYYVFDFKTALLTLICLVVCVATTITVSLYKMLKMNTATLLSNINTTTGRKIMLEKTGLMWNKLKFLTKITLRNTFFSKFRLIMTVIGIGGCTMLLLTGLGLSHAVKTVSNKQYSKIHLFQQQATYKTLPITNEVTIYNEIVEVDDQYAQLFVGDERLNEIINFDQTFNKDDVIITNKIKANIGQTIKVSSVDKQNTYYLKVTGKTTNHIGNFIYVGSNVLQKEHKTVLIKNNTSPDNEAETTIFAQDNITRVQAMIDSIDVVIIVIVILSLLLVFVVTYNITVISISERIKELATLKVLGFYPKEIYRYIFNEVLLLSFLGILFGLIFGEQMFSVVLKTVEGANITFDKSLPLSIYLITFLIVIMFTLLITIILRRQIKKINMLEALKSYD